MQKIVLITIGSLKESWAKEAAALYGERLSREAQFTMTELPASKEKDPSRQREDESLRLLAHAKKIGGDIWVLDETGKGMTSQSFAKEIDRAKDESRTLVFLLGGAFGLTDDVKKSGKLLRLSDMTLPHELCRVLFLEQLYRALEINRGSKYHH